MERRVEPPPCACGKCGSSRLHKLGETVSKTLECEPRRWKIIEHVREKFSCRDCEAITEPPAPSHAIPRGFAESFFEIDTSTLADRVGACVVALDPIVQALKAHVLSAARIHTDDTTLPVLAKMKTATGRIWTPASAGASSMSAMTGRLAARIRQRPFLNIRAAVRVNIRKSILLVLPESCRLTRLPVMLHSMMRGGGLHR